MRSFFGAALLGCGVLIAALSGLCTVMIVGGGLFGGSGDLELVSMGLVLGGIPCLVGVAMVWLGRRQIRNADQEARDAVQSDVFD